MDAERFKVLVNVLSILKKQPVNDMRSMVEIIENYREDMTPEQKAKVLDEMLHFTKGINIKEQKFEEVLREEKLRHFTKDDY